MRLAAMILALTLAASAVLANGPSTVLEVREHGHRAVEVPAWDPASPQRLVRIDGVLYQEDAGRYFRVVPGRIKVRLADGVDSWADLVDRAAAADPDRFAALTQLTAVRTNRLGVVSLAVPAGADLTRWAELAHRTGLARYAEVATYGEWLLVPDDPQYPDQWSKNNTGQSNGIPGADVDAEAAWDIATGDPSVVVAVIDSGTDIDHEDLAANVWHNDGEIPDNGIDDDANGYIDDWEGWDFHNDNNEPRPVYYHGTHVTGIVNAAGNNGIGIAGMAGGMGSPGVLGMALGAGDESENGDILDEAILYAADMGAHIITLALSTAETQAINDALDYAHDVRDVFINNAAGNGGDEVNYPGRHPYVMAVAATGNDDTRASFSNPGPEVEVAAPGENILSTQMNDSYGNSSGTSFASPHVAGLAALIRGINPSLTAPDVRALLILSTEDVEDPGYDVKTGHGRINAFQGVTLAETSDGVVRFLRDDYTCADSVEVVVIDADLAGTGTVGITIESDTEPGGESMTLGESNAGSGMFRGTIATSYDAAVPDGVLQVADGDMLTARYVDTDDGFGGSGVPKSDVALADCVAPAIANVRVEDVTGDSAVVAWTTGEASSSQVTYGAATPPSNVAKATFTVVDHAVDLDGLTECTVYYHDAISSDRAGNVSIADNGGAYFHFETLADFGQGLQPCHQGRIAIDTGTVGCESTIPITLGDRDLNTDPGLADTVVVTLTSTTEPQPEPVVLTETGPDTSTFVGSIPTAQEPPVPGDGTVQVTPGDVLTATYDDDDDGTGNPATASDTAIVDCDGPAHLSVAVRAITDHDAEIAWSASEDVTGYVEWGVSPALGNQSWSTNPGPDHVVTIGDFDDCERVYFRVVSTDLAGNPSTADADGEPFEFNVSTLMGIVHLDGFESAAGWTLDGEWEIGAPLGLGTAPGDPAVASEGTQVLGHDLSGLGSGPGDYEFNRFEVATSPAYDLSGVAAVELRFDRWLNVENSGNSSIEVKDGGGTWHNIFSDTVNSDTSWNEQVFDVSTEAANNGGFQVRFQQNSRFGRAAGWNVDRMILRDATIPPYGACGGCGGAPTFAGAVSATDDDPCADSGVTVSWSPAPAWGTGGTGTYSVYRDTSPGFTPGPGNLVATGVATTSWTDDTAVAGVTLYYVVRAENDESCASGPNNGGMTDDNLVYVEGVNETSQTPPGDVGGTLQVDPSGGSHVRLSWGAAAHAVSYHVYRSTDPGSGSDLIGNPTGTVFEDLDALSSGADLYYRVHAVDACGNESEN